MSDYRDFNFGRILGYPELAPLDSERILVSDWGGVLSLFDLKLMQIVKQVFVGEQYACCNLTSLRSRNYVDDDDLSCVVATRGGYGVFWDINSNEIRKIIPNNYGSVSSIDYSPDQNLIALGLGNYSLSNELANASLEIWSLNSNEFILNASLPGCCVDSITFNEYGDEIVCLTGMPTQSQSFLCHLDSETLRPINIQEIADSVCRRVEFIDDSTVCLSSRTQIKIYNLIDKKNIWLSRNDGYK